VYPKTKVSPTCKYYTKQYNSGVAHNGLAQRRARQCVYSGKVKPANSDSPQNKNRLVEAD